MGRNKFQHKLWKAVNESRTGAIQWSKQGDSVVFHFSQFKKEYLEPNDVFCKSSNLSSFVRQLNLYGFKKIVDLTQCSETKDGLKEYINPNFVRGRPDLLKLVTRNNAPPTAVINQPVKQEVLTENELYNDINYKNKNKTKSSKKASKNEVLHTGSSNGRANFIAQVDKIPNQNLPATTNRQHHCKPFYKKIKPLKVKLSFNRDIISEKENNIGKETTKRNKRKRKNSKKFLKTEELNFSIKKEVLENNILKNQNCSYRNYQQEHINHLKVIITGQKDDGCLNTSKELSFQNIDHNSYIATEFQPGISECLKTSKQPLRDISNFPEYQYKDFLTQNKTVHETQNDAKKSDTHLNKMCKIAEKMGINVSERLQKLTDQRKVSDACAAFSFYEPSPDLLKMYLKTDDDGIFLESGSSKILLSQSYRVIYPERNLKLRV